jgi:hypothetical protein
MNFPPYVLLQRGSQWMSGSPGQKVLGVRVYIMKCEGGKTSVVKQSYNPSTTVWLGRDYAYLDRNNLS